MKNWRKLSQIDFERWQNELQFYVDEYGNGTTKYAEGTYLTKWERGKAAILSIGPKP